MTSLVTGTNAAVVVDVLGDVSMAANADVTAKSGTVVIGEDATAVGLFDDGSGVVSTTGNGVVVGSFEGACVLGSTDDNMTT